MIELRHIQELEKRVHAALELIGSLRGENAELKSKLEGYQGRIDELERLVNEFKEDQGAIEEGILRALRKLDSLEDTVTGAGEAAADDEPAARAPAPSEHVSETPSIPPSAVEQDEATADVRDEGESPSSDDDSSGDEPEEDAEEENAEGPDTGESELDIF
jgi:chromosome segregation ATPase